jgi:DNA-binding transcriptional LysR family regulator
MEMHQIRYFLGVARTLNFTRAAEECNVSQPSLTRAIKLLEDELGGDLFRRERGQSHLTDLGQRMLPLLQQCYDTVEGAKLLATSIKKGEVATLRLALARTVDLALVLPFLSELLRAIKGLELKFIRGTTAEIVGLLKAGDADLALAGHMGEAWDRLESRALFTEPFVLLVHEGHRLAVQTSVSMDAVRHERLLIRTYCEMSQAIAARISREGVSGGHNHQVASERDLISLLENRMGVAVAPKSTVIPGPVRRLSVTDLNIERTIYVHSVAGRPRSASASTLLKQLLAADWQWIGSGNALRSPARELQV